MSLFSKILNLVRGAPVEMPVQAGIYRPKPKVVAPSNPARVEVIESQVAQPAESTPITRDEYRDLNIELAYKNHPLKVDPPKEPYPQVTGLAPAPAVSGLVDWGANASGFGGYTGMSGWIVTPTGGPAIFDVKTGQWTPIMSNACYVTGSVSHTTRDRYYSRPDLVDTLTPQEQRELLDFVRSLKNR